MERDLEDEEHTNSDATQARELVGVVRRQHPGEPPERIREIILELGTDIDDATLERELAAVDQDEHVPPSPSVPPPQGPGGGRWSQMLPLVAIGVVVLVVVVVASALLRSPDPTADEAGSQQGESAAPQYAPTGPGSDPALDGDDVLRDSFERSGEPGELGDFPDVGPWVTGRGAWAVSGGILQLSNGETTAPNVAWVDPGATDLRAQVTLTEPEKGAGLAFRIQDADNFWLWLVVPEYSTVALVRVEDAEAEVIDNPGLVAMRPGMTVGVHLVGSTIELLAQGVVVMTVEDADPPQGTGLGVGVAIGETTAAFSELAFVRAS